MDLKEYFDKPLDELIKKNFIVFNDLNNRHKDKYIKIQDFKS